MTFMAVGSQGSGLHRVHHDEDKGERRAVSDRIDLGHTDTRKKAGTEDSMSAREQARGGRGEEGGGCMGGGC